jgi:hypothetical protein
VTSVTRSSAAVSSRLPVPPPLTIGSAANSRIAATIAPRRSASSAAPLHEADRGPAQASSGRLVAHAGDLTLVGHQRGKLELGPAVDFLGERDGLLDRMHGRALRAGLDPAAQRPPARVDVDADPDRGGAGPEHRLDRVEVLVAVDHHDWRSRRVGYRAQRQLAQRPGVGGRVGQQQVLEPLLGKPERLRQGEGHQPGKAGVAAQDAFGQRPAAQRLARHPDRLATCATQHLSPVGRHRIEVDEGKRRLHLGEDLLIALVRLVDGRIHSFETNRAISRSPALWFSTPERWPSG